MRGFVITLLLYSLSFCHLPHYADAQLLEPLMDPLLLMPSESAPVFSEPLIAPSTLMNPAPALDPRWFTAPGVSAVLPSPLSEGPVYVYPGARPGDPITILDANGNARYIYPVVK